MKKSNVNTKLLSEQSAEGDKVNVISVSVLKAFKFVRVKTFCRLQCVKADISVLKKARQLRPCFSAFM